MKFLWIGYWWVLLVPLATAWALWAGRAAKRKKMAAFAHPARHPLLLGRVRGGLRKTRSFLALTGLLLASLAALGPSVGFILRPVRQRGVDLLFLLDVSRSMLAADVRPSRLERAKRDIRGLLPKLTGERVGLVAFAGTPVLVCPLTHDYDAFEELLQRVNTNLPAREGTDLGRGLEAALRALGKGYEKSQAILLLSDGEDLGGEWEAALEKAVARKVRVYAIGYGTPEGAKITIRRGNKEFFLKGPDGKEVVTHLDERILRETAKRTGGDYLRATSLPLPLEEILEKRIKVLQKRTYEKEKRRVPWNRYQWPLSLGVLLLLLRSALPEARREEGP